MLPARWACSVIPMVNFHPQETLTIIYLILWPRSCTRPHFGISRKVLYNRPIYLHILLYHHTTAVICIVFITINKFSVRFILFDCTRQFHCEFPKQRTYISSYYYVIIITFLHGRRDQTNCDVCPIITVSTLFCPVFLLHLSIILYVFPIITFLYGNVAHAMDMKNLQVLVVVCSEFRWNIVFDMISSLKSIGLPPVCILIVQINTNPFLFVDP